MRVLCTHAREPARAHACTHAHSVHVVSAGQVCFHGEMSVLGGEVFLQPAASSPLLRGRWPPPWRTRLDFHLLSKWLVRTRVCVPA